MDTVVESPVILDAEKRSVCLRDLRIDDAEVYRVLSEVPADRLADQVRRALKVGVIALRDAEMVGKVDFVDRSFHQMRRELEAALDRHLGDKGEMDRRLAEVFGDDGALRREFDEQYGPAGKVRAVLDRYFGENGELQRNVLSVFGDEGSLDRMMSEFLGDGGSLRRSLDDVFGDRGKLKAELERHFGERGSVLFHLLNPSDEESILGRFRRQMESLVDPNREGSPFADLKKTLQGEFKELHAKLEGRRAAEEEREKSSRKGIDFEEFVCQSLTSLAGPLDDRVEHVGTSPGPLGDAGDVLVTLNPHHVGGREARLVVEVKNRAITLRGKSSIYEEVERARKNRDALYSVVVVRGEEAPSEIGALRIDPKGAIICTVEEDGDLLPLEVAYKVARAEAIRRSSEGEGRVDTREVYAALEKVRSKMEVIKGMKASLTGAEKSLRQVKEDLDTLREGVREILDRVTAPVPAQQQTPPAA